MDIDLDEEETPLQKKRKLINNEKLFSKEDDGTSRVWETTNQKRRKKKDKKASEAEAKAEAQTADEKVTVDDGSEESEYEEEEEEEENPDKSNPHLEDVLYKQLMPLLEPKDWCALTAVDKRFFHSANKYKARHTLIFVDKKSGNNVSGGKCEVVVIDRLGPCRKHERLVSKYTCEDGYVNKFDVNILCGGVRCANAMFLLIECEDIGEPLSDFIFDEYVMKGSNLLRALATEYTVPRTDFIKEVLALSEAQDLPRHNSTIESRLRDYSYTKHEMVKRHAELAERRA